MKLSELLEQVAQDHLDDRTDMLDGVADSLWSDKTITRYLNEAQRILARRAWVITDIANATAGVLTLVTSKATYALHKSVLRVYYAQVDGDAAPLPIAADRALLGYMVPDMDYFDVNQVATLTPGPSRAWAPDAATRTIRIYPPPSSTENGTRVLLKVARMPITWLDVSNKDACPEVPEDWHDALAIYAAGRCLRQANVDSQSRAEGQRLMEEFDAKVREARQERARMEYSGDRPHFASDTA